MMFGVVNGAWHLTNLEWTVFGFVGFLVLLGQPIYDHWKSRRHKSQHLAPIVKFPTRMHRIGRGDVA